MIKRIDLLPYINGKILFYDADLLVISKPSGILSHPNTDKDIPKSVIKAKYNYDHECYTLDNNEKLYLIHRLDKDTSGVILLSSNEEVAKSLQADFKKGIIKKTYVAICYGKPVDIAGSFKDHITRKEKNSYLKMFITPYKNPNTKTNYSVLRCFSQKHTVSLIEVYPETGKTHQIRAVLGFHKLPIIGDEIYGNFKMNKYFKQNYNIKRQLLHAQKISFKHPVTKKEVTFEVPVPHEFEAFLKKL
jgi:RluA family pseudouridine synthase